MRQGRDAGGIDAAHMLDGGKKAVEVLQHMRALVGAEFEPGQMGQAINVLRSQCHSGKDASETGCKSVIWRKCDRVIHRGCGIIPPLPQYPRQRPSLCEKEPVWPPKPGDGRPKRMPCPRGFLNVRSFPSVFLHRFGH